MALPDPSPSFTWNAADYSQSSPAQYQWGRELIGKLMLSEYERVLDIGCGDGRVTAAIAACVPKGSVTGIDSSYDMIRFAQEHFPPTLINNLSFVRMDASHLDFFEEYDLVFSNAALHWIPYHIPLLTGIARSLCPGGRVLLQMGGKGNAAQIFEVLTILLANPSWEKYYGRSSITFGFFLTPEDYRQWLTEVGLEPIRVDLIPKDMIYPDRESFAGYIRTTWLPWMALLPEEEQPRFIREFIDEYLAMYPADAQGMIHIGMVRLEVEAIKPASSQPESFAIYKPSLL
jgi:trans-aconitate 2-methyltransferase